MNSRSTNIGAVPACLGTRSARGSAKAIGPTTTRFRLDRHPSARANPRDRGVLHNEARIIKASGRNAASATCTACFKRGKPVNTSVAPTVHLTVSTGNSVPLCPGVPRAGVPTPIAVVPGSDTIAVHEVFALWRATYCYRHASQRKQNRGHFAPMKSRCWISQSKSTSPN